MRPADLFRVQNGYETSPGTAGWNDAKRGKEFDRLLINLGRALIS